MGRPASGRKSLLFACKTPLAERDRGARFAGISAGWLRPRARLGPGGGKHVARPIDPRRRPVKIAPAGGDVTPGAGGAAAIRDKALAEASQSMFCVKPALYGDSRARHAGASRIVLRELERIPGGRPPVCAISLPRARVAHLARGRASRRGRSMACFVGFGRERPFGTRLANLKRRSSPLLPIA